MLMSLVKENTRLWTILGNKEFLWVMIQTLTIVFMELMVIIVIIICNRLLLLLLFLLLLLLLLFLLLFLFLLFLLLSIADLIMLGLATHEPYFTILREEFKPNQPRPCEICNQYGMYRHIAPYNTLVYVKFCLFFLSLCLCTICLFVCNILHVCCTCTLHVLGESGCACVIHVYVFVLYLLFV